MTAAARDVAGAEGRAARNWSRAEVEFALAMFAAWNQAFAGVVGGCRVYDTRRNRFVAIQFARRNAARPPAERFSPAAVAAAIAAYAEDPVNRKLSRWKSFGDFMREAEELIDRQLTRTGTRRDLPECPRQLPGAAMNVAQPPSAVVGAAHLRTHLWAVDECVYAAQYQMKLVDYLPRRINELERAAAKHAEYAPRAAACKRLLELEWQFERLSNAARQALEAADDDAFRAVFQRDPARKQCPSHMAGAVDPIDAARLHGLALALLSMPQASAWGCSTEAPT